MLATVSQAPVADGIVALSDGSRLKLADGRPVSLCGIGMLCTNIEWDDDRVRLTAASGEDRWIELTLTDGVVSTATAWDGRTVAYDYDDGQLVAVDDGFVPRSCTYADGVLVEATDRDRATWAFEARWRGARRRNVIRGAPLCLRCRQTAHVDRRRP
jgi:hypothetical protein